MTTTVAQDATSPALGKWRWDRRADLLIIAALVLGTLAMYARTATYDFVNLDDGPYVYANPRVLEGVNVRNVLWALTTGKPSYWHPLTFLSLMLDVELFGQKAGPMHIHNAVLHAANSALLFVALMLLTGARWPSAWVAAMFAWHPLRVESVAWVTERKDVLSGLFFMLCIVAYGRYVQRKTVGSYVLVALMLVLGLLSKPSMVAAPGALLLLDFWPLKRLDDPESRASHRLRRFFLLLAEKIPLLLLAIGCAVITYIVQAKMSSIGRDPLSDQLGNAVVSYGRYLWMTIVPKGLAIFYPLHTTLPNGELPFWKVVLSAGVLVLLTVLGIVLYRRVPAVMIGWLWYLGLLVPMVGIVQSGSQSHADRFTYLPQIGVFIAIAWGVAAAVGRWPVWRKPAGTLAALMVVAVIVLSWRQIGFWRDTETVMTRAMNVVPNNYLAHRSVGEVYDGRGDQAAAAAKYHEALRIKPNDAPSLHRLGLHASKRGDIEEAKRYFKAAVFSDPSRGEDYNNYANMLLKQGRIEDALKVYRAGIQRDPDQQQLYHNLALTLGEQGTLAEAIPLWRRAIELDPEYADARASLGAALLISGSIDEGIEQLQTALQHDPEQETALKSLAWLMATHPNPTYHNAEEAIRLASRAVELAEGEQPIPLDTLAAAQARAGRFEEAIQTGQRALEAARAQQQPQLAAQIQRRIDLYRSRQPFTSGK